MPEIYVVMYDNGEGIQAPIKALYNKKDAEKYIQAFDNMPSEIEDDNGNTFANDDWFDPDCCYIEEVELE